MRVLSDVTERMLDTLPPYYASADDALGTLDTVAHEIALVDSEIEKLAGEDGGGELFPLSSDTLLAEWETLFGLPTDPAKSVAQRRNVISALLTSLKSSDSAGIWESTLNTLIGSGWSYRMDNATYSLTLYLPFGPEMTDPISLAASASGSGGSLAAGTYRYAVTAVNAYGESKYENSVSVVVSAGQSVQLSWSAPLIGVPDFYYIYRGDSVDTMRLLLAQPITTTSFTDGDSATFPLLFQDTALLMGEKLAPTVSSTQSAAAATIMRVARAITPAHINLSVGYTQGFILDVSKVGDLL